MRPARSLALGIALAVLAAGCASGPRGATAPHAIEQVLPAKALDIAAARVAARAFVGAYADAADDRGLALERLVVGRELTRWVRWLGIQNGQFEGDIRGAAEVREVRFLGVALGDTYDVARVQLRATVTFDYAPEGGEPFTLARVLDGPMLLVRVGQEDWKVADVTREGALLSEGIRDLGRERVASGGVAVLLDSAFVFAVGLQVNVTVENRTGGEIRLASVTLATDAATADGRATLPLRAIPRSTGAIGIFSFGVPDASGATLEVRYRTATGTATLRIPLGDLLGDDPVPSPTADAAA